MKQNSANEIKYYVKDACFLKGIEDDYFDIVISAMCLMAVEDLESAIKEAYRVLKLGGELVVSILHPCFEPIDYFSEGAYQEELSEHLGKPITFWHKTLSKTINTMIKVGFNLELLNEPALINYNQKEKTPRFLLLKLKK